VGVIIRGLHARDRDDVHELLLAWGAFTGEEIEVALEMASAPDDYRIFAAEIDGKVRGFTCLGRTPLTATTWHLYWIGVHPGVQGTGVGQALQSHAERFVRAQGGERLVLEMSGRPDYARARRFYQGAGYREVGRIEDYYRPGDDCVILCKAAT
jgi:ribosomal protein S18 acetylase RimI-like enzyme